MFQFTAFASCTYVFSARYPTYARWVSPFGHLRIKVCLPTPLSFSQAPTSFIASNCQGIRRVRLVAWKYILTLSIPTRYLNLQKPTVNWTLHIALFALYINLCFLLVLWVLPLETVCNQHEVSIFAGSRRLIWTRQDHSFIVNFFSFIITLLKNLV